MGNFYTAITLVMPLHIRMMTRNYIAKQLIKKPIVRDGIRYVANSDISYVRIFSTSEKETETCEWIASFPPDAIFWDVGANIGIFTLLAAKRDITTYAFEPHPANYLNLVQNIDQNKFSNYPAAFPIALHDHTTIAPLHLSNIEVGTAWNSFAHDDNAVQRTCKIDAIGFTADEFIARFNLPIPTHIKMDVDGNELRILAGASATLANPTLREMLIEVDTDEKAGNYEAIENAMNAAGFQKKSVHKHGSRSANVIFVQQSKKETT